MQSYDQEELLHTTDLACLFQQILETSVLLLAVRLCVF